MKIIRTVPNEKVYFKSEILDKGNAPECLEMGIINVFDEIEYQQVIGFGGAFTESAAYNYANLTDAQKKQFMELYFDKDKGIGYNFGRIHINSCDFSLDIYSCVTDGDITLESFNIEREKKYIIPFVKDAQKYSGEPLTIFASPWSPPAYMKDNESVIRGGKVKEEFKAVWAKYYTEYIKAMRQEGIDIWAITVQNEPIAKQSWESCYYSADDEREFIEKYLIKALDDADMNDIKIIVWDHNKERVYDRAKKIFVSEMVKNRVFAVGHHWYSGDHFDGMRLVYEKFGKICISSENCGGISDDPLMLAERYGKELCGDFNNFTAAYCDWNLLLSDKGGPFHNRGEKTTSCAGIVFEDKSEGCHAPILYNTEKRELEVTPIYYYIGHFSKYVKKGAIRIATTKYCEQIHTCAFKNPDGKIVLIMINVSDMELPAVIRHSDVCTETTLPPHSAATVIL